MALKTHHFRPFSRQNRPAPKFEGAIKKQANFDSAVRPPEDDEDDEDDE